MTNTTRDLIQRLAHELCKYECLTSRRPPDYIPAPSPLVAEARAYLDKPEPEWPTDEELLAILSQAVASFPPIHPEAEALSAVEYDWELEIRKARAVIAADRARWRRPAIKPVPVSERPWERDGWCDGDGWCWAWNAGNCHWWEWIDSALISFAQDDYTHSLPHYALPVPTTTQETP